MPIFQRRKTGDIPTPPRAMTNLFDATCTLRAGAASIFRRKMLSIYDLRVFRS
jgi:hypothetical protein